MLRSRRSKLRGLVTSIANQRSRFDVRYTICVEWKSTRWWGRGSRNRDIDFHSVSSSAHRGSAAEKNNRWLFHSVAGTNVYPRWRDAASIDHLLSWRKVESSPSITARPTSLLDSPCAPWSMLSPLRNSAIRDASRNTRIRLNNFWARRIDNLSFLKVKLNWNYDTIIIMEFIFSSVYIYFS